MSLPNNNNTVPSLQQTGVVGYHEALTFGGPRLRNNVARIVQQSPVIGGTILDDMGTMLGNTSLSYRDWALVTISALAAMGDCTDQLNVYVEGALRHGVAVEEILDLFHHSQAFAGTPRAVNALRATWETLSAARTLKLPEGYTETLVRLGDHDTLIRDTHGEGVPIILIHALCMDSRLYKDVLPALSNETGARVIAYDMRGHGQARGAPITKNIAHLCTDLETLMDTLKIEKADIYGSSYGGAVAQTFALDYTSRVRSLVPMAVGAKTPAVVAERATKAEQHGMPSVVAESIIRWFNPNTIAVNPWCVRYARGCVERARIEEWAAAWRAMAQFDATSRLKDLTIPVMALSGTDDASATPPLMQEIVDCSTNGNAEFVSIEGGTHMMVMEAAKPSADALIAFRRKVDGMIGK